MQAIEAIASGRLSVPATSGNDCFSLSELPNIETEFGALGLNVGSEAAPAYEVDVAPLPNRRHTHLFRLFADADALTQHQAVEVCRMLRESEAFAVLVPFFSRGDYFVADMRPGGAVYIYEMDYKFPCDASKRTTLAVRRVP